MSANEIPASASASFTCNACKSIFENSASQRMHFKTDLHVANVKRQVESLSSGHLPLDEIPILDATQASRRVDTGFDLPVRDTPESRQKSLENAASEVEVTASPIFNPSVCLFCIHRSSDLDENLVHMQTAHGLSIPEQGRLIHVESFLHYLFTIIFDFNECLYCGIMKGSVKGIQQHMLTKGHSKMNKPEKGSDYRDFYDFSEGEDEDDGKGDLDRANLDAGGVDRENLANSTGDFVLLSSGRTLGHRLTARGARQNSHQSRHENPSRSQEASSNIGTTSPSPLGGSEAHPRPRGQLTTRKNDEKGLVGVPEWQKRMIRATEKKMLRVEIRARNRFEAAVQRAADERADLRQRRVTRVPDSI